MIKKRSRSKLRIAVNTLLATLGLIVLIHAVHALTLDRIVVYNEITFSSPNIPAEMDGYRIAFVTDIHMEFEGRLQRIVEELNRRRVDLLLLGGDFTFDSDSLDKTMELLSQITTTDGAFGVEGNHDKYQALFAAMEAHNITPLSNSGQYVRDNFFLAGVEDLWNRNPDVTTAIVGAGQGSFVLLLSHNPDVSMQQDTTGVDLILSGHTHGGQMNFFDLWSLGLESRVISEYGERFRGGWSTSRDGTPIYVCRGVGEYYPRVFARPEVTIITLASEAEQTPPDIAYEPTSTPTPYVDDDIGFDKLTVTSNINVQMFIEPMWEFDQVFNFREGMAAVEYFEDGQGDWGGIHRLGYINNQGEIVIPLEYRHQQAFYYYRGAPSFSDGMVGIFCMDQGAVGFFNTYGELVVPFIYDYNSGWTFSHGLNAVSYEGKWGFIDITGEVVIPFEFDFADGFSEGLAAVRRDEQWGFIDTEGNLVIPFKFDRVFNDWDGADIVPRFSEGRVMVGTGTAESIDGTWIDNRKWGFVDRMGEVVVPFIYTRALNFSEGLAAVQTGHGADARWGFIDTYGNITIPFIYDWVWSFSDGIAIGSYERTTGLVDKDGNFILLPDFANPRNFSEGLVVISDHSQGGRSSLGFVDRVGEMVMPTIFGEAREFSHGLAAVAIGDWETGFAWGLIDKEGNVALPFEFEDIRSFSEGLAWVRRDGLWGLIHILD